MSRYLMVGTARCLSLARLACKRALLPRDGRSARAHSSAKTRHGIVPAVHLVRAEML